MVVKQFYLECLAHASYMIADEGTKIAAVIDPQRDIQQYLREADTQGYKIQYVFLTHFHADFVAGHLELHEQTGARICLGAKAVASYQFIPLKNESHIVLLSFLLLRYCFSSYPNISFTLSKKDLSLLLGFGVK